MADAALRFRVRVSVALILAYYVVQTLVVARVDEPYPALMMPRFSWAGPLQVDGFETKEADLVFSYRDGVTRTMKLAAVLEAVPEGHRYTMMDNLFAPIDATTYIGRSPWGKLVPPAWLFPGYGLGRGSRKDPEHQRALARWLLVKAREFHAGAPAIGATALWFQAVYRSNEHGDPVRVKREPSGRFEVDLHDVSVENR